MKVFLFTAPVILLLLFALQSWCIADEKHAHAVWNALRQEVQASPSVFDPGMVDALPEPARQYFLYTIQRGAPLHNVTEIRMHGELGLGTKDKPNYLPMRAEQILAPPFGLVWKLDAGSGFMRFSGSDGTDGQASWVRFWLLKTVPIVRAGGTADHLRAAFGRVAAEAVFWAPATLLPQAGVAWEAVGADVARVTLTHDGMTQTVDITVADDGRPTMVVIPRWSDANPDKEYRLQPFGGYLSEFRDFDGYNLPTRVEGGNFIGTGDYFPFYKAQIDEIRFIQRTDQPGH